MKAGRLFLAGVFCLGFLRAPARAEEDAPLFLSLTRRGAARDRMPSNVSVVTQAEIRESGAKTLDQVLDSVPSVDVTRTGTLGSFSTVRLRGVPSSAQVQVLVDDEPLGGVSSQFIDLSQIPVENIDRIEIVRGGSSVLYGANTIGGVIHVITKRAKGDRPLSSVGVEARSFKTQIYRADLGVRGGGFDGYVNGSRYFTDGFQQNADGNNLTLSGRGGYDFAGGARVEVALSRSDHEIGDPQGTTVPLGQWDGKKERAAANPTQRVDQDINTGRVKIIVPVGSRISVQSGFYGYDQFYRTFPAAGLPAGFDQRNQILGNDTRFLLPGGLTVGGSYERDQQDTVGAARSHVTDWGLYAEEQLSFGRLDLIPAVRLDQHSAFGNVVNPRLTAVVRPSDAWKISANAARSFRAPSFLELFFQSAFFNGNPDLRPETAWTYDLGAEFFPAEGSSLGVTGFHTRIRERIAANLTTYRNSPRAEISGVEVENRQRWGSLTEEASYTYQRAVGNSLASSRFVPLRLTPRHMAHYRLTWAAGRGWSLTNAVQYVHRQFQFDGEKGGRLPSYTLWNARLSKRILSSELYLGVDNITDKRYAESFGFHPVTFATTLLPQPGRTIWGGITVRFID